MLFDFAGWIGTQFLSLLVIVLSGAGILILLALVVVGFCKLFGVKLDDSEVV